LYGLIFILFLKSVKLTLVNETAKRNTAFSNNIFVLGRLIDIKGGNDDTVKIFWKIKERNC